MSMCIYTNVMSVSHEHVCIYQCYEYHMSMCIYTNVMSVSHEHVYIY